jgi:hypothetical protein
MNYLTRFLGVVYLYLMLFYFHNLAKGLTRKESIKEVLNLSRLMLFILLLLMLGQIALIV